jgi:hypothetical protein
VIDVLQQVGIGAGAIAAAITATTLVFTKVVRPAYHLWRLTVERTAVIATIVEREMGNGNGMRADVQRMNTSFQHHIDESHQLLRNIHDKIDAHVFDDGVHMRREIWDQVQRDAIRHLLERANDALPDEEQDG